MRQKREEEGPASGRADDPRKESGEREREQNRSAFEDAMHDIDEDAELSASSPNDDLDEGETARLGEDKTDLV